MASSTAGRRRGSGATTRDKFAKFKRYPAYSTSQEDQEVDEGYRTHETTFEAINPSDVHLSVDTGVKASHKGCNGTAAHMGGAPDLLSSVVNSTSPFPSPRRPLLVPAQSIESSSSYESQSPPPNAHAHADQRRSSRVLIQNQRRNSLRWLCNNKLISNKRTASNAAAAAAALTSSCGPTPASPSLTASTPHLARSDALNLDGDEDLFDDPVDYQVLNRDARVPELQKRKRVSVSQGGLHNQPDLATIPSYDPTSENLLGFADLLHIEKVKGLTVSELAKFFGNCFAEKGKKAPSPVLARPALVFEGRF